jgi:hypothetical protein
VPIDETLKCRPINIARLCHGGYQRNDASGYHQRTPEAGKFVVRVNMKPQLSMSSAVSQPVLPGRKWLFVSFVFFITAFDRADGE